MEGETKTIFILGRKNYNRCIQGDIVAVELLPKSQWKRGISVAIEDEEDEKLYGEEDIEGINKKSEDAMEIDETIEGEPTGKIVGIIRKKWRPYVRFIMKRNKN